MQPTPRGERLIACAIGLICGVGAGVVGVMYWIVAMQDLATRLDELGPYVPESDSQVQRTHWIFEGTLYHWVTTTPVAVGVMLVLCVFAAFLATYYVCGKLQRRRDMRLEAWVIIAISKFEGVLAARVAAGIAGAMCLVATFVAKAPADADTNSIAMYEALTTLVFFIALIPLISAGVNLGIRTRRIHDPL